MRESRARKLLRNVEAVVYWAAVAPQSPGVNQVPEPPLGGRHALGVVVLPAPNGGHREAAGPK